MGERPAACGTIIVSLAPGIAACRRSVDNHRIGVSSPGGVAPISEVHGRDTALGSFGNGRASPTHHSASAKIR
jgi:hypothetical protein